MLLVRRYGKLLEERPILTKCVTSFFTFGMGDLICQYFEKKLSNRTSWDKIRTFKQASLGFCITPYLHLQFAVIMPYLFPNTKKINVFKSVVYDQTIGAIIFTTLFFTYLDLVSGKNFQQIQEELKIKLFPTLKANWTVWPLLMLVNFSIVPVPWRVLFANICGMFWGAYLSFVQNVKSKKSNNQN